VLKLLSSKPSGFLELRSLGTSFYEPSFTSPPPGGKGRALPRLRPATDVVVETGRGVYLCYDGLRMAKRLARVR